MGIEPTAQAWEAWVLPLYDARGQLDCISVTRDPQMFATPRACSIAADPLMTRRQRFGSMKG